MAGLLGAQVAQGDNMDAVRTRVAGLSARDDAERGEAGDLLGRQARAKLAEIGHRLVDFAMLFLFVSWVAD